MTLTGRELASLYVLNFTRTFITFVMFFKFPLLFEELGFSGAERGDIFSATPLCALVATFWLGVVSDRVDARYVMAAGLLGLGLFLAGVAHSTSFVAFLGLFALSGVAGQAFNLGSSAYFFKSIERSNRESVTIGRYSASSSFGVGVALLVAPLLIALIGLKSVLLAVACLPIVLLPFIFTLRPARAKGVSWRGYFSAFRSPQVVLFAAMIFLFAFHWGSEVTCYSPLLTKDLGIAEHRLGYFMGPPLFFLGASSLAFGFLGTGAVGPRGTLGAAFFFSGVGAYAMVNSTTVGAAFAWRLVHEVGDGAFFLFMLGGIHRLFDRELVGGSAGLVWLVAMAGQGVGALLSAPLGVAYGNAFPQEIAGILSLVSMVGILFLNVRQPVGARAVP